MRLALGFADLLVGLSHVMDGNANKAVSVLQPTLEIAEHDMGRRSTVAAMLAGPLAAALMLRGEPEQALATLADRLDVIERVGMPDPTMLAYRTLAAIAMRRGEEARALEILAALHEFGVTRDLPRVHARQPGGAGQDARLCRAHRDGVRTARAARCARAGLRTAGLSAVRLAASSARVPWRPRTRASRDPTSTAPRPRSARGSRRRRARPRPDRTGRARPAAPWLRTSAGGPRRAKCWRKC